MLRIATYLMAFALLTLNLAVPVRQYFTQSYTVKDNLPALTLTYDKSLVENGAIIRLHDKSDGFFCSAFVVSNEYAITAGHCLDESFGLRNEILIYNSKLENTGVVAEGVAVNRRGDTGLIHGDFTKFDKLPVGTTPQEQLLNLAAGASQQEVGRAGFKSCGYPYGDILFCPSVTINGTQIFHLAGQGLLYPGMSGGPVINSDGAAVAINSYANETNVGFSSLIAFFASFKIKIQK